MSARSNIYRLAVIGLLLSRAPRGVQRVAAYMTVGAILTFVVIVFAVAARSEPQNQPPANAATRPWVYDCNGETVEVTFFDHHGGEMTSYSISMDIENGRPWRYVRNALVVKDRPRNPLVIRFEPDPPKAALPRLTVNGHRCKQDSNAAIHIGEKRFQAGELQPGDEIGECYAKATENRCDGDLDGSRLQVCTDWLDSHPKRRGGPRPSHRSVSPAR